MIFVIVVLVFLQQTEVDLSTLLCIFLIKNNSQVHVWLQQQGIKKKKSQMLYFFFS